MNKFTIFIIALFLSGCNPNEQNSIKQLNELKTPVTVISANCYELHGCWGTVKDGDNQLHTFHHSLFSDVKQGDIIR